MLALVTILSDYGAPYYAIQQSAPRGDASEVVLINTDNIIEYKADEESSSDTFIHYKMNLFDDASPEFWLKIDETAAALKILADTSAASNMITLPVFEGAYTFGDVTGLSTTDTIFNIQHIVWANESQNGHMSRIWVAEGGFAVKPFIVDYSIDAIVDVGDTGTTTTSSTSSTSTSSTSTSSTSSTSTSSTSTISTSTSSTSSTSTSSTSTSSTSTSSTSTSSTSSTSTSSTSSTSTSSTSTTSTSSTSTSTTTIA